MYQGRIILALSVLMARKLQRLEKTASIRYIFRALNYVLIVSLLFFFLYLYIYEPKKWQQLQKWIFSNSEKVARGATEIYKYITQK